MSEKLTAQSLYQLLKANFPAQNDFNPCDYEEELMELNHFGIRTKDELTRLLEKHTETALKIDREPLDAEHIKWYKEDDTIKNVDHKIENEYWFALPGLLRLILELEFGEAYTVFADKRDGI